jgi:hypothetical protein
LTTQKSTNYLGKKTKVTTIKTNPRQKIAISKSKSQNKIKNLMSEEPVKMKNAGEATVSEGS